VHAVSMIPHEQKNFHTTLKSENHMQNKNKDTACILKNLNIFANSNYEIRKGFSPLIMGPRTDVLMKKPRAENFVTLSL
jgi:hypothetical protein